MTPTEIQIIRATFEAAARDSQEFAVAFRDRSVALDPLLRTQLPAMDRAQAVRIAEAMRLVIGGLDATASASAKAQAVALRHRWPGIQPYHYGTIGQALLDTLAVRLGEDFTDTARAAWASAFVLIAEALMARCYNLLGLVA